MAGAVKRARDSVWGVCAEFDSTAMISKAAQRLRDAGYKKWDVYTPVPIHGMDEAMGLGPSKVSWIVGTGAAIGAGGAYLLQWWASAIAFPVIVNNKPFGAWEQFIPITFELSVLLACIGALFGMLILNGLPRWHHPMMSVERFLRVGDDRFFIAVESADKKFDAENTRRLLEEAGGVNIEMVEA